MPKIISLHDVLEPLKQALLASRDVIISSQICGSNLQKVFTLGDGCWLPTVVVKKASLPFCFGDGVGGVRFGSSLALLLLGFLTLPGIHFDLQLYHCDLCFVHNGSLSNSSINDNSLHHAR